MVEGGLVVDNPLLETGTGAPMDPTAFAEAHNLSPHHSDVSRQCLKCGVIRPKDGFFTSMDWTCDVCIADVREDPVEKVAALRHDWMKRGPIDDTSALLRELLQFAVLVWDTKTQPIGSATQRAALLKMLEKMLDSLQLEALQQNLKFGPSRSADGILNADDGVFPLFQNTTVPTLPEALKGIDLVAWGGNVHWPCGLCNRPTNDPYEEHMAIRHPATPIKLPKPPALGMDDVFKCLDAHPSPFPAITVYTMETPIYRAANMAMREWARKPELFQAWKGFSSALNFELHQAERFKGNVFRFVDRQMPPGLYMAGAVVTWNQPSSASLDPKVCKEFLQQDEDGKATLFIIQSLTARPISKYSLYPEEEEVLFPAGTQFQVRSEAEAGLKKLLELALHCNLDSVDVYQMRELKLDSWRDLEEYLEPVERVQNQELLALIKSLPTKWEVHRGELKLVCAPMSQTIRRMSDRSTALHLAVSIAGNLTCIQLVMSQMKAEDLSLRNEAGLTALQVAVEAGNGDAAVFLLHRGADFFELTPQQRHKATPFIAERGDSDLVTKLYSILRREGQSAAEKAMQEGLAMAVKNRNADIVEIILDAGTKQNPRRPALVLAAESRNLEAVQLLLQIPVVDVNAVDRAGRTALMAAAQEGHGEGVRRLLDARASVFIANHQRMTALTYAAKYGRSEVVQLLLHSGSSVQHADREGDTALMVGSQNGDTTTLRLLLEAGSDVAHRSTNGSTALFYAAQRNHANAVSLLLAAGAQIDVASQDGTTALIAASQQGQLAALQALLAAGANVNCTRKGGETALIAAAREGYIAVVRLLLDAQANVHATNNAGMTALAFAAEEGHLSVMEALLEADPTVASPRPKTHNPLLLAAQAGHAQAIQLLIDAKVDVDTLGPRRTSALVYASTGGHTAAVRTLLRLRADVHSTTLDGTTPLLTAALDAHVDVMQLLVECGAKVREVKSVLNRDKRKHAVALKALKTAIKSRDKALGCSAHSWLRPKLGNSRSWLKPKK